MANDITEIKLYRTRGQPEQIAGFAEFIYTGDVPYFYAEVPEDNLEYRLRRIVNYQNSGAAIHIYAWAIPKKHSAYFLNRFTTGTLIQNDWEEMLKYGGFPVWYDDCAHGLPETIAPSEQLAVKNMVIWVATNSNLGSTKYWRCGVVLST